MLFKFYTYPYNQRAGGFDFGYHHFAPYGSSKSLADLFDTQFAAPYRQFAVSETDNAYVLTLELPGFKQSHLEVELDDGVLVARAKKDDSEIERSVNLPIDADSEKIEAKLEDGILTVTVGKVPEAKPRKIQIK